MKKTFLVLVCILNLFCGVAYGNSNNSSNTGNESTKETPEFSSDFKYAYNPPTDNYYIVWQYYNADGTASGKPELFACVNGDCTYSHDYGYDHYSKTKSQVYSRSYEGDKWEIDPSISYEQWQEETGPNKFLAVSSCDIFDEAFIQRYYVHIEDKGKKLADIYVGTETIAGVECYIFDTGEYKYWIDPSNSCCLKSKGRSNDYYVEVVTYNLNYTEWTDNLAPVN